MKRLFSPFFLLPLIAVGALTSCKKDCDTAKGLESRWRLTERMCYCPQGSVPNETLMLTASTFAFYKDNHLVRSGTYSQTTTTSLCGVTAAVPALRFVSDAATASPYWAGLQLTGNTLVLDYGIACDAPRETYVRVP